MEGLVPLSNVARKKLVKRFPIVKSLLVWTLLWLWAIHQLCPCIIADPGDCDPRRDLARQRVMPLGDLSQFVFFIACMVPFSMATLFAPGWPRSFCLVVVVYCIMDGTGYQRSLPEVWYNPDASVMYSSLNPSANPFTGCLPPWAMLESLAMWWQVSFFIYWILN